MESIDFLMSHQRTRGGFGGAALSAISTARATPIAKDRTFYESRQDMKKFEDALRSEAVMDAPLQDRRELEAQCCVMLQAMTQAHFDLRRRRSPPSRSGMSRPSSVPSANEALGW